MSGVPGEVKGGLARGVPGAHHGDALALHRPGLGRRGSVEHAHPDQAVEARDPEAPVRDARGDHHRARDGVDAGSEREDVVFTPRRERRGTPHEHELGAELARLVVGAGGELAAAEAAREPEVVADPGARARLPAERARLDDERSRAPPTRRTRRPRARPARRRRWRRRSGRARARSGRRTRRRARDRRGRRASFRRRRSRPGDATPSSPCSARSRRPTSESGA